MTDPDDSNRGQICLRAYVAFAGGGAKGLVHVGALRALEEHGLEIRGVSGTSAGALVAVLKAAGYGADEIVSADASRTIIDELSRVEPGIASATDLFGPALRMPSLKLWRFRIPALQIGGSGWSRVRAFSRLNLSLRFVLLFVGFFVALLLISLAGAAVGGPPAATALVLGWGIALAIIGRDFAGLVRGLVRLDFFHDALDKLLSKKLFPSEAGRRVTMADFGRDGRPQLRIVSADLKERRLKLFSAERTPDTPVADAVAASICIPFVFAPWPVGADAALHVDGGIVSNLPAWAFDEERELDPDALTIAIEIADTPGQSAPGPYTWIPAAFRTALFGSSELNLRAVGRAELIELETTIGLLEFDLSKAEIAKRVAEAANAARFAIDRRIFRRPELYRRACDTTRILTQAVFDEAAAVMFAAGSRRGRVRVALAMKDELYFHSLRLRFGVGFEDDADEAILLPIEGSITGAAWSGGEAQFEIRPFPSDLNLSGDANRQRRRLVWRNLAWTICIPIYRDGASAPAASTGGPGGHLSPPEFVVTIDGDDMLRDEDEAFEVVSSLVDQVRDLFSEILLELQELEIEDEHETPQPDPQQARQS